MLCDINGLSVVANGECGPVADDIHLNVLDGILGVLLAQTDGVVMGVHQQLIHELVEAGIEGHLHRLKAAASPRGVGNAITDKHLLLTGHDAANVRVGKVQDVLAVRLALVVSRESHGEIRVGSQQSFRF